MTWRPGLAYPVFMQPEIREFLDHNRFHAAAVRELAGMLPTDDAELDTMIGTAAREHDLDGFQPLVFAALHAGRKVDARHLAQGAALMYGSIWIGLAAFHMTGDVAEHLMEAVRHQRVAEGLRAESLFIVAGWCQERRAGVLPEDLITLARMQARTQKLDRDPFMALLAVTVQTKDEGLEHILHTRSGEIETALQRKLTRLDGATEAAKDAWKTIQEVARGFGEVWLGWFQKPVMDHVPAKPPSTLPTPIPLRRAVARVGRNEPCPCGSGKKYKHCCVDKDQARLMHSSPVAGQTWEELMTDPEAHLSRVWLERCDAYQVARFDPKKIPAELLPAYFERLFIFRQHERATEALEQLGYSENLAETWKRIVCFTTQDGRRDLVRRLVALRSDPAAAEKELAMYSLLLLAEDDPVKTLEILETGTLETLHAGTKYLRDYTLGLLDSRFRGVAILVARGVVPFLSRADAALVFEHLLLARDRLKLPPDDPCEDLLDRLFLEARPDESKDAAALREAQRKLGDKVREVGQLKESLEQLQRDLARREKAERVVESAPKPEPAATMPGSTVDPALKELRGKVEALRTALKERHGERNELRRELQKAHGDLEELRQKTAPAAPMGNGHETDHEEDWLLPQEAPQTQPVRVIEFPKHFQESLASLPKSVARGTLTMLGRLAAGEPAAFVGAVRLKACPSIMRHRIGIDFRLLFRLLPDRVQVVDLIPRQDLERRIKTLV